MSDEIRVQPIPRTPPRVLTAEEAAQRMLDTGYMFCFDEPDGTRRFIDPADVFICATPPPAPSTSDAS